MKEQKLSKLFAAARQEPVSMPPADFDVQVLQAIRQETRRQTDPEPASLFDQLNRLFPRLAWASLFVIAAGIGVDYLTSTQLPDLTDGVTQISNQWLFALNGL
jgi:hypothetical protein